jgi:hypothetical protein
MIRTSFLTLQRTAVLAAGLVVAVGAAAQGTYQVRDSAASSGGQCAEFSGAGDYNNTFRCVNGAGANLTISAWSSDRGLNRYAIAKGVADGSDAGATDIHQYQAGSGFANAYLNKQGNSGFGAASRAEGVGVGGAPNHAFDSVNPGTNDMMLLDFGSTDVVLNKIGMGWTSVDADITLLRWRGDKTGAYGVGAADQGGTQTLSNAMWNAANPTVGGWELVGSYADLTGDNATPYGDSARTVNTGNLASSWWLVSTFNTALNGNSSSCRNSAGNGNTTCDAGNEQFKLNFIVASSSQVPVPGSLALAGLALGAAFFAARRRQSQPMAVAAA